MRIVGVVVAIALVFSACGDDDETRSGFEHPLDEAALQAAFDDWGDDGKGGGVAAVRAGADGEFVLLATGIQPDGTPLEPDAIVRVGSISKTVVAALVLGLVEEGVVDLDEPLLTYLPSTPVGANVTVRQLLSHRSGIANYTESPAFRSVVFGDRDHAITPNDVFGFVGDEDALFEPGSEFSYSNTNYILLGQLVESVSGQSINDELDEEIADSLGLDSMHYDDGTEDIVDGYTAAGTRSTGEASYRAVATAAWTAGSLVSSTEDLGVFLDALLMGEIVSEEYVAEMWPTPENDNYGFGLLVGDQFGVGHNGSIDGFNSLMQLDPGTGDVLVVVVNNDQRRPSIASQALYDAVDGDG